MSDAVEVDQFFYVCSWLAVQTGDHEEVARLLGASETRARPFAEWAAAWTGPRAAIGRGEFFVCAPVDGWTLVFGEDVGLAIPPAIKARRFAQVHAFFLDDKRGNYHCERAIDGTTVRVIAEADRQFNAEGSPDPGEPGLPVQTGDDTSLDDAVHMSQEMVLRIAEAWGADPTQMVGWVRTGLWCRSTEAVQARGVARQSKRLVVVVAGVVVGVLLAVAALIL